MPTYIAYSALTLCGSGAFFLAHRIAPISTMQWLCLGSGLLAIIAPIAIELGRKWRADIEFRKAYLRVEKLVGPMRFYDQVIQEQVKRYAPLHLKNDRDILAFYRKYEQKILFSFGEWVDVLEVYKNVEGRWELSEKFSMDGPGMRAYTVRRSPVEFGKKEPANFELIAISSGYPTPAPLQSALRNSEDERDQREFRTLIQIFDGVVEGEDGIPQPTRWKMYYYA